MRGRLRRRLLVNAVVDPAEASQRLPEGLRPHETALGTVVGRCLLEIEDLRPARLPATTGITLRAAAHRISVEWDDEAGERIVGVYVPDRRTDSRLAVALGGRWFPGVYRSARVDVVEELDSGFISSFSTAMPAPAYLMENVGVAWTTAVAPRFAAATQPTRP